MRTVLLAGALTLPLPAFAQVYAHPLFVEAVRDPGRAEELTTPRAVALAGLNPATGAEHALTAPSGLVRIVGGQIAAWGGPASYERVELAFTPGELSRRAGVRDSSRHWSRAGGFAAAYGYGRWGVAALVETSGSEHAFNTGLARLAQSFAHGSAWWADGSGAVSISARETRYGAAAAVALTPVIAVGGSLYWVHSRREASAVVDLVTCTQAAGAVPVCDQPADDVETLSIVGNKPGIALSATLGNEAVRGTGRWRREPAFTGARPRSVVKLDRPDVLALDLSAGWKPLRLFAEVARERRENSFVIDRAAESYCDAARIPECLGWGFGAFELPSATAFRVGGEVDLPAGGVTLRGGYAIEPHRFARIGSEADVGYEARALRRWGGGLSVTTGPYADLEFAISRDRHEVRLAAGVRVHVR